MSVKRGRFTRRALLLGGAAGTAYYALSNRKPSGKGPNVAAKPDTGYGPSTPVMSEFEKKVTSFTQLMVYKAKPANYTDDSQYLLVMPSKVYRIERDHTTTEGVFIERDGTKTENLEAKVGDEYIAQFNCPEKMSFIDVAYGGLRVETQRIRDDETGMIIAQARFKVREGRNDLTAIVNYFNGTRDDFKLPIRGVK